MKKIFTFLVVIALALVSPNVFAQGTAEKATSFGKLDKPTFVVSIAQQIKDGTFVGIDPNETPKLGHPKGRGAKKME